MTGRTPAAEHALSRTDRLAQWWAGWRVAIVTAWRDARRHGGTTALIMVMIGLPVLLITGFGTFVSTTSVSSAERLHWELGNATAKITPSVESGQVTQSPDGSSWGSSGDECDECASKPRTWTSAAITHAVGGQAYQVGNGRVAVAQDGRPLGVSALTLDFGGFAATGIATLKTGSWPTEQNQILVSPELVSRGLPSSGTISVTISGGTHTMTVVGTAEAIDDQGEPYGLMGLTGAFGTSAGQDNPAFLIMRSQPFTWSEIVQLNTQGLVVVAPEFVLHPDRADLTGAYSSRQSPSVQPMDAALVALMIFGLLLETTLLAGPAFAVSTTRRRRTLALVASNGATRQQLRRYVLGQGLVMGVLAAVFGAALGVALPALGFPVADHIVGGRVARGPFQPNWPVLAASATAAVVAALVSASLAARGASRLDIAQALAGRTQPRTHRGIRHLVLPVIAALATTGAMAGCAIIVFAPDPQSLLTPAALLSIVGALGSLFLVGTVIDLVGRLHHGPIAMRIAVRDGQRNRNRTLPAVAAITATVAVMTMLTISNTSDMAQQIRDYTPSARYGDGLVYVGDPNGGVNSGAGTIAEIRRQHPHWQILPVADLGKVVEHSDRIGHTAALVPNGCDASKVLDGRASPKCSPESSTLIAPVVAVAADPPGNVASAITNGTAVVVDDPQLVHDGHATIAVSQDGAVRTIAVPALLVPKTTLTRAFPNDQPPPSWIPPALATREHLPTQATEVIVHNPDGPISAAEEKAINERVTGIAFYVERGPIVWVTRALLLGMLAVGGFLVLVAALIATALGRAESRADLATLSAVGASGPSLRRIAAAQALLICLVGAAQGFVTGLLPGMALAAGLTGNPVNDLPPRPIIDVPWTRLLGGLGAVAVLTGLLAAVSVRRLPLVRRVE